MKKKVKMLHSAVIEVRQHLCCANVFLKFKQSLTDAESLKINAEETKVQLKTSKCSAEIFVDNYFLILAGTLSNLIFDTENASFRISIKDIQLPEESEYVKKCLQVNLNEKDEASVMCSNCEYVLAVQQKYDKIREFPTGTIDISEFFCHHGPSFQDVLIPSNTDLFYGFQFIVVNKTLTEKAIKEKETHLYCRRCLRYLGETLFNGRAAKLWCDSIQLGLRGQIVGIFALDEKSEIHRLLLKAIEETSLPSPEPLLRNMHFTKVLLIATFPNRQENYLLLHILEKDLTVLRNRENSKIENSPGKFENTRIEIKMNKAFKILYRLVALNEDNTETTSSTPLLEYWQRDINILKIKISPYLFIALIEELDNNINILPEIYRVNNDDFKLSYIFY